VSSDGGSALLRGQILQLLLTSPGERVNVPEFGTRLRDLVFDPNNDVLAASTEFMIKRALQTYLSDAMRVEQVAVSANDGLLQVNIVYLRTSDLQFERVRVGIPLPG
jgi:phage baseplate assembly protein W